MRIKKVFDNCYIDYNYYLNYKNNYLFLKFFINKHNKKYLNSIINKDYIIDDKKLDKNQKEAVFSDENNILVLSSAGSGKTLTICAKIRYLIEEKNIKENEILCLSFTNDSVNDLKERINYNVDIFTFHKLALEILKDYNISNSIASNYLEYIIEEIFISICKDIDPKTLKYFVNTISCFINLLKNNNYNIDKIKKNNNLLKVIEKIYYIYEEELYSSGLIDFNDMINKTIELINKKGLKRYYKYIIIDEFQDISLNRYNLIKTIKDACNTKLFVVGDDYQSIYRFAGSYLKLVTDFKKYFGYTKIIKLVNTYRNSLELIKASNSFILKNKNQIKKNINSNKHIDKPIKIIYFDKNLDIKFNKLVDEIDTKIMVLGRNNYDLELVSNDNKKLSFYTVHKSKGLEEENVIVLNLVDDRYGFPNKKKEEVLDLLLPKEKYLYEEERRLFYVALTRTKNNVFLFVDKNKPSVFIKEIIRKNKKYIEVLNL